MYDINTHGDFQKYYDTTLKRNIWLLGYYGGGSINVSETYELAKQFAKMVKVPLETVQIDEILSSRRFKGFKFLYSTALKQPKDTVGDIVELDNVYKWFRD